MVLAEDAEWTNSSAVSDVTCDPFAVSTAAVDQIHCERNELPGLLTEYEVKRDDVAIEIVAVVSADQSVAAAADHRSSLVLRCWD